MKRFLSLALLLLFAATARAQYVNYALSNGTAPSCSVSVTGVTAGDAIIVDTFVVNATQITSVKDQAGNVLPVKSGPTQWSTSKFFEALYFGTAPAGGTETITVTLAASVYSECYVYDYKPMQIDAIAAPVTGSGSLRGTNNVTTTASGDLLFAFFHSDGGSVNTAVPNFVGRPTATNPNAEDMIASAAGPYSASMTFAPAANYVGFLVAFKFAIPPPPSISIGTITVMPGGTPPHSVGLTWNESSSGVTGYNVYRNSTGVAPYTKLNASPLSAMNFTDGSVAAGNTYYYVVTAVNANGESGYSQQVQAVIPTP